MNPRAMLMLFSVGGGIPWTAVTGTSAVDDPPIRQGHPPRIDELRSVLGQVTVDDEFVAEFDVALLPAAPGKRARVARFAGPVGDVAFGVGDIEIEVRMGIRPFDPGDRTDEPDRLRAIKLRGKGMVSRAGHGIERRDADERQ